MVAFHDPISLLLQCLKVDKTTLDIGLVEDDAYVNIGIRDIGFVVHIVPCGKFHRIGGA